MIQELEQRIKNLEIRVNQTMRIGVVTSVLEKTGQVRVKLLDSGGIISKELPVLFPKTHANKAYDMPDVGEHVLCLFLPCGLEQGFVIGALYSDKDVVPVADRNKTHYIFSDQTWLEYDREIHVLTSNVQGALDIKATGPVAISSETSINLTAPRIDLN